MSACFQEHAKFPGSLRFNLGVGDVERLHDDDALAAAAKAGGIEYLRDELGGFDRRLNPTEVRDTERSDGSDSDSEDEDVKKRLAASLSRGQWQRIAIGRAFLKNEIDGGVDLCVYDEPTASLDPVAEVSWLVEL